MPKKTKREKLLADHRKVHLPFSPQSPFQFTAQTFVPISAIQIQRTASGDLNVIQKDLLKTVILAVIAIFSEILLAKIIR